MSRALRRNQILIIALVALVGVILSILVFNNFRKQRFIEEQKHFADRVQQQALQLRARILASVETLQSVEAFYSASEEVSRDEFRAFVTPALLRHPEILALEFSPRVPVSERLTFERTHVRFLPRGILDGGHGMPTPAAPRSVYFPVLYAEPMGTNKGVMGLDHAWDPAVRTILDTARGEGSAVATRLRPLVRLADRKDNLGTEVYVPIYEKPKGGDDIDSVSLQGFAVEILHIQDIVARWAESASGTTVYFFENGDSDRYVITSGAEQKTEPMSREDIDNIRQGVSHEFPVPFGGRDWRMLFTPRHLDNGFLSQRTAYGVFAGGLLLTGLLCSLLYVILNRAAQVERTVKVRTDELQENQIFLASMIDNLPVGLICKRLGADEHYTTWNPMAAAMTGVSEDRALGKRPSDLFPQNQVEVGVRADDDAIRAGCAVEIPRIEFDSSEMGKIVVRSIKVGVPARDGKVHHMLTIMQDITARVKAEAEMASARDAALDLARTKSDFLANMSHEIRTPMNAIVGMSGLLQDTELTGEQKSFVSTIHDAAENLLDVINEILDFSKIEAGRLESEEIDFDLRETVEGTLELVAPRAHAKGLALTCWVAGDIPSAVHGDQSHLRQILINLLSNATKFTEKGDVYVRVTRENSDAHKPMIRFSVKDSGIGISEEAGKKLFQPFTQADSSTTRKYGGTGLGLAICRKLATAMGGEIGFSSVEGEGTTFFLIMPLEIRVGAPPPPPPLSELGHRRVLIVDDNEANRRILLDQLSKWGLAADAAASGAEALSLIAAAGDKPYHLAILDSAMPGMDGAMLAAQIRLQTSSAKLPIAVLSSLGIPWKRADMVALGISEFLTKPIRQKPLYECLRRLLSGNSLPVAAAKAAGMAVRHPTRILVVEDTAVNQKVILLQLDKLGYRADTVGNGKEALEALAQAPYDIVLMDCQMPVMDGYEATAEIRRRYKDRHLPVIAMTANAMEGDKEKCLAAGMTDYVSKPVRMNELEKVLTMYDQPVDEARVKELMELGGSPEFIVDLLTAFYKQADESMVSFHTPADVATVMRAAHSIKGAAANVGAEGLRRLAEKAEKEASTAPLTAMAQHGADMAAELTRVKTYFKDNPQLLGGPHA